MASSARGASSCLCCRARKVRCDRVLPQCSPCKKRKLDCEVPSAPPKLFWLRPRTQLTHEDYEPEDLHSRRQPLFTGPQLAENAGRLMSLAADRSILPLLEDLEQGVEELPRDHHVGYGPFHAFRALENQDIEQCDSSLEVMEAGLWDEEILDAERVDFEDIPPPLLEPSDLSNMDNTLLMTETLDLDAMENLCPLLPGFGICQSLPLTISPPPTASSDIEGFDFSMAKRLLDHYRYTMIPFSTPARVSSKSPWETIYIPSVMSTLGEIGLYGDSGNAKVSLLFGIFAISAFCLHGRSAGDQSACDDWSSLGDMYREKATRRLKLSLRDLSSSLKKEKYKDILMALLSMVTISVVSGKMRNAAHYLRDIEEMISLHGLRKSARSSKVRMLHSIYLYLRVLTECASMSDQSKYSDKTDNSYDFGSCRHFSNWDQLIGVSRCSSDSELNGIELSSERVSFKTPFEDIYSVPQSLFKLILRTAHVTRQVNTMESMGRLRSNDYDDLAITIKQLENRICNWSYPFPDHEISDNPSLDQQDHFPYHLVQAIHKALIIYFYRCVRDVNASILQIYVREVIDHLTKYDLQKQEEKDNSANTCWPGFIAGCEALQPDIRHKIAHWLEQSGQDTGIRMFTVALEAVQKVWQARDCPGMEDVSWSQVLGKYSHLSVLVLS